MSIVIMDRHNRDEGRQHVNFMFGDVKWADGSVPITLTTDADVLAYLQERADIYWCGIKRNTFPLAEISPAADETLRQAWERVLAAGVDDTLGEDGEPAGIPLDDCRPML